MQLSRTLSSRLLLALSLTVPFVFLSTAVRAETGVPQRAVKVSPSQPTVKFTPNLDNKLRGLQPGNFFTLDGIDPFVEDHGPTWVEYHPKGKMDLQTYPVVSPSAVDTFNQLRVDQ